MKQIIIHGGKKLKGKIPISGMKNAAVALIPAAVLCDEEVTIENVPNISDKQALIDILNLLNVDIIESENSLKINNKNLKNVIIPNELTKKLRASYYFMGALLGRKKHIEIYFPGGCNIGNRKIDYHLKGFESLGATIKEEADKYIIHAEELHGNSIYFDFPSVGATINIMLAAVKAKGKTTIHNAAKEPDVINVAQLLKNMGAQITGEGTDIIEIEGITYLHKASIKVMPDRIEAGTYIILGALMGENLEITHIIPEHLTALTNKLKAANVDITIQKDKIITNQCQNLKSINIKTLVYPGFVTDWGQPMSVLLTQCRGKSLFEETIYENRMGHIPYLNKMGANIEVNEQTAFITGPTPLKGTNVVATDLRAGASLLIAGLVANGTTIIDDANHILRGYEKIVEKLTNVGANIELIDIK